MWRHSNLPRIMGSLMSMEPPQFRTKVSSMTGSCTVSFTALPSWQGRRLLPGHRQAANTAPTAQRLSALRPNLPYGFPENKRAIGQHVILSEAKDLKALDPLPE